MYRCKLCGEVNKLVHRATRVDTIRKQYRCPNGHQTLVRRYGDTIEIEVNGQKTKRSY